MSYIADNVKVLLWISKREASQKTYNEYIDFVAKQCRMAPDHFRAILRDEIAITDKEENMLRRYFSEYSDNLTGMRYDFLFSDLMKDRANEILTKNLQYLLGTIKHGENAEFVETIGINPSTLTRWKQGKSKPDKYAQKQVAKYFGLRDSEDLRTKLLFLDLDSVTTQQKKQECIQMIGNMSNSEFEVLFPALKRMLK